MKERPILFSAPMIRALIDGSKSQTRRIVKKSNRECENAEYGVLPDCPYGQPGDRLWVRESHAQVFEVDIPAGRPAGPISTAGSPSRPDWKSRYVYSADGAMPNVQWHHVGDSQPVRWTPSIHMPRIASRILLEIVSVRVERLNDCSEVDAISEGVVSLRSQTWDRQHFPVWRYQFEEAVAAGRKPPIGPSPVQAYEALWESINGAGSWGANPFVWVIEFRRLAC